MRRCARRELLARVGGEEFGSILPAADLEAGVAAAERARASVAAVRVPGVDPSTISVGISVLADGDDASDLQRAADSRAVRGLEDGRNRVAATPAEKHLRLLEGPRRSLR